MTRNKKLEYITKLSMYSLAIHSHKGGVGKTTIAVNLAILLAKSGKNVCLIDYDYGGPNLYTFFRLKPKKYLNSYFNNESDISECFTDISSHYDLPGKFLVGLADPSSESVNYMLNLDSNAAMKMLQASFKIKKYLKSDPHNVDYIIFDTTPGLALTTINSFLLTDQILFIIKFSNADIDGTIHLITGLLDSLNNRATLLANNIPYEKIKDDNVRLEIENMITDRIRNKTGLDALEFLGWLPADYDLASVEFECAIKELKGEDTSRTIHALSKPDHLIIQNLEKVKDKLFKRK